MKGCLLVGSLVLFKIFGFGVFQIQAENVNTEGNGVSSDRSLVLRGDSAFCFRMSKTMKTDSYCRFEPKFFDSSFCTVKELKKSDPYFESSNGVSNKLKWDSSGSSHRSGNWFGLVSNVMSNYSYQQRFQTLVRNYRSMLFYSFNVLTNGNQNEISNDFNELYPTVFGKVFHSVTSLVNLNSDFGKLYFDPSLGFGNTGFKLSYTSLYGTVSSNWNMGRNNVLLRVSIPIKTFSELINPNTLLVLKP